MRRAPNYILEFTYLIASILFIFGLKGLSHPGHGAPGHVPGRGWHGRGHHRHAFPPRHPVLWMDHCRPDPGLAGWRGLRHLGSDDGDAAANRAFTRLRRDCRVAGRHRRVHHARQTHVAVYPQRAGPGGDAGFADHHRLADRLRQIAGRYPRNAGPVQGTAIPQSADLSLHGGLLRLLALQSFRHVFLLWHGCPRIPLRRHAGDPDWIGGHAGGDVAVEQLCRVVVGRHGICAGQQHPDHCRHAGWILRFHPLDPDVQGDEPLDHQRSVRRLRRGASRRRRGSNRGDARDLAGRRCASGWPTPARSSSFPATDWPRRRRSTPCATWPTPWRNAASP